MRNLGISQLEDNLSDELLGLGHRYHEVDLGSNLFSDWAQVARLLKSFANVNNISFASNKHQRSNIQ